MMKKISIVFLFLFMLVGAGSWERAITFVFAHEGGYTHDGGWESNYGICSKWYPKVNMKTLTEDSAKAIYWRDYWCRMSCQVQPDSNFALLIFDTAVLFGQPTTDIMLRRCYYDKDLFMDLRFDMIQAVVHQDTSKIKYLATWMKRTRDLQKEICCR